MQSIFKIFQGLQKELSFKENAFNIASLPQTRQHKVGISPLGYPVYFIKCEEGIKNKFLDINLELISVQFNQNCQLFSDSEKMTQGIYTIVLLKTETIDLQEYFLEVVFLLVKNLTDKPTISELKSEMDKLVNLFSKFSKPATKTIQGLWAEVLIIEQSNNPEYLLKSWHKSPQDKFDFNDGMDKLEIKSTAKSRRVHKFSTGQLTANANSNLLIASVFVVETGLGKNIFDLIDSIKKRVKEQSLIFILNEVLAETLGLDLEKSFNVYFDYQLAIDSIRLYDSRIIPQIDSNLIPSEITNITFDCDLTNIQSVKEIAKHSILYNALNL